MTSNVLFMIDDINYNGGAHIATFNIIKTLHRKGFNISIYTMTIPNELISSNLSFVNFIKPVHDKNKYERKLLRIINNHNIVCVPFENSIFRDIASRSKIYKIQWIHINYRLWRTITPHNKQITENDQTLYSSFDKIVFVSKSAENGFLLLYPDLYNKTSVCYNLIDVENIRSSVKPTSNLSNKNACRIVTVSRIYDIQKGIKRTLNIIKKLYDEGYNFIWEFVGYGEDFDEMTKYSSDLGLDLCVKWTGHTNNPYQHLYTADLFALLSYYEGNPLSIYEALSLGVPVISTYYNIDEDYTPDNTGWKVDNNEFAIYEGIKYLLDNQHLISQAKDNLRDYKYDLICCEKQILDIFEMNNIYKEHSIIRVSVIVPVYNVENYLKECLDSLISQTLNYIEIIIVDDGSTDNSPAIIKEYADKYHDKVISVRKENGGLSDARNYGLKYATGQYIMFVDSDDWIEHNMLELMFNIAVDNDYDIILCDIHGVDDKTRYTVIERSPFINEGLVSITNATKFCTRPVAASAWGKLYKKEIFDNIKYPFALWYEDQAVTPVIFSFCNLIYYLPQPLYNYRWNRNGSIQSQKKNPKTLDIFKAQQISLDTANKKYINEIAYSIYEHTCRFIDEHPLYKTESIDFLVKNKSLFNESSYVLSAIYNRDLPDYIKEDIIPKKIHYCWFGRGVKNKKIQQCIESWKKHLPDYEIFEWNEDNCDVDSNEYTRCAYKEKKWAFVADFFRFQALYEQGGIYLDTDMLLHKSLDDLLRYNTFFPAETFAIVCAGIIGCVPKSDIIKEMIKQYNNEKYDDKGTSITICHRITNVLTNKYNYQLNGETQFLNGNIAVFSPNILIVDVSDGNNYCEHLYSSEVTWFDENKKFPAGYTFRYEVLMHYFNNLQKNTAADINNSLQPIDTYNNHIHIGTSLLDDTRHLLAIYGAKRVIWQAVKERIYPLCPKWLQNIYQKLKNN